MDESTTAEVLAKALNRAGVTLGVIADQASDPGTRRLAHKALDEINELLVLHLLTVIMAGKIDSES